MKINDPHTKSIQSVFKQLDSSREGLSDKEARKRLEEFGLNELPEDKSRFVWTILFKQFNSWLVLILLIAAGFSWMIGELIDTWVIILVVFINAAIGFFEEYRAERAVRALKKLIVQTAKVYRNNKLVLVPSAQIVVGDVLLLEEGDRNAADGRIIQSNNLRMLEAALTGESLPSSKEEGVCEIDTLLADRKNMLWSGTFVAGGSGKIIVTATREDTAIGEISETLKEITQKQNPFQKKTDVLAKQMAIMAIASAVFIFIVGYFFRDYALEEIIITSIAVLVAAIPEGLPAVLTIVLAIGAHRMAKRNAIVRDFGATEALGSITTILTDKTGTLTQNSLTVKKVLVSADQEFDVSGEGWSPIGNFIHGDSITDIEKNHSLKKLLEIALISNNSEIEYNDELNAHELIGDPTEGALLVLAKKAGLNQTQYQKSRLDDRPFNSNAKYRATLNQSAEGNEICLIGAPEKLLSKSKYLIASDGETELTDGIREQIQSKIDEWSESAMRVIALAYKKTKSNHLGSHVASNLTFAGITAMIDPPRPDSKMAVEKCQKAGIRVVMLTGDHINTAVAIANATGIIGEHSTGEVVALTEKQLLRLKDDEFDQLIETISVFARLSPKMKLKIAKRLQEMGQQIAMTGDGVNDAPALKQADVGISMGIMGTEVAREASDVILADDNFSTIVNAIEEGRIIFTNAQQSSFFLITTNIAESVTLLLSMILGLPLPLLATQILWLNLVTDGVSDMALATEPGHDKIMEDRLFYKKKQILNKEILPFLIINVVLMAGLSLYTFFYYIDQDIKVARTAVFVIMASTQLFNVFNLRSIHKSVFKIGLFSNRYINLGVGLSILLMYAVTELPALAQIFHFQAIPFLDFVILFFVSSSILWIGEGYKFLKAYLKNYSNE